MEPVEAEKALLATVMLDNASYASVAAILRADDFSLDSHRRIYGAMTTLAEAGKPIEPLSLGEQLGGDLQRIGGYPYLVSLTDGLLRVASGDYYAAVVLSKSKFRQLQRLVDAFQAELSQPGAEFEKIIASLQDAINALRADDRRLLAAPLSEFSVRVADDLHRLAENKGEIIGYSSGIAGLDADTTGIRDGELWVFGALPGRGKTSWALQALGANAKAGVPCAFFSLEMTKEECLKRICAQQKRGHLTAAKLRDPRWIGKDEWPALRQLMFEVAEWPLFIDDASGLSVRELVARARLYIRRHRIKLIAVDYVRLVHSTERELRERVGSIVNGLRQLAKDEGVAVIALSQLARPRDRDINAKPTMLDLKESGDIEAHAHAVLLSYMPTDESGWPTGGDELIIGKQRNGPLGARKVHFDRQHLRFEERETACEDRTK